VREIYERFAALVRDQGPVEIEALKTRIGFKRRNAFAAVTLRKRWMNGHLVIAEPFSHPLFERIESYSPRLHVHHFRIRSLADIDDAFALAIAEACSLGAQEHLGEER